MKKNLYHYAISLFLIILCSFPQLTYAAAKKQTKEEKFVIGAPPGEGFFSLFLVALVNIMWADKHQKTPVVHWSEKCLYAQKEEYNGSFNPWEYYFEPVSHLNYEEGDVVHNHFFDPNKFSIYESFYINPGYFDSTLRFKAKAAVDKYISVKPNILEKANSFYEQNMQGKTTIGIHLRGTDKVRNKEVKQKLRQLLIDAAERAATTLSGDIQFYIATDEIALLDFAKEILQKPVIYRDSRRSEGSESVHGKKDGNHFERAVLGEEVLIDMLLLSQCDFLVHSLSCVPIAALIFNPTLEHEYVFITLKPYHNQHAPLRHKKRG